MNERIVILPCALKLRAHHASELTAAATAHADAGLAAEEGGAVLDTPGAPAERKAAATFLKPGPGPSGDSPRLPRRTPGKATFAHTSQPARFLAGCAKNWRNSQARTGAQ